MATVLIADDSMFMRKRLSDILTENGHDVVAEAEDGNEAIMQFRRHNPELVMLDITMPERNGFGALGQIMAFDADARVVMCSALGEQSVVESCLETGAKAFIVKPFDPEQVVEAVTTALA
ncbi:MAG: response regulator [Thermoleophilaceae bacterium]|nr:response regulator [Thermoleophilaceae bacterium]